MSMRQNLMACSAILSVWLAVPAIASAQSMSDTDKIQKLERQTELLQKQSELLQRQLKEMKEELARTRKQTEKVEAKVAAAPAGHTPSAPASAAAPMITKGPAPVEKVKVTLGGFVAAESVWRSRNEVADMGSNFGAIPYPFTAVQRERISRLRPAEPDLAAGGRQYRSVSKALGVLRNGLPRRGYDLELQSEQQLGSAPASRLSHL
jgi:hypothetical protein